MFGIDGGHYTLCFAHLLSIAFSVHVSACFLITVQFVDLCLLFFMCDSVLTASLTSLERRGEIKSPFFIKNRRRPVSVVRGATVRTRLLSAGRRDDETTAGDDASELQRPARKPTK